MLGSGCNNNILSRHEMETLSALPLLCEGNPPVTSHPPAISWRHHVVDSVYDCSNSFANALELQQSCIEPFMCHFIPTLFTLLTGESPLARPSPMAPLPPSPLGHPIKPDSTYPVSMLDHYRHQAAQVSTNGTGTTRGDTARFVVSF